MTFLHKRTIWRCLLASAVCLAAWTGSVARAEPVTLNVVDVAGNLALTQKGFEAFRDKYPDLVSRITFTNAPSPQLPGKIKAMQAAGRADIDIVLTGTDALAAGIQQNLWQRLLPDEGPVLEGLLDKYPANVKAMQALSKGYGLVVTFSPAGPLLEYNPDKIAQPPRTPAELLAWCQAHPGKLIYARPANSGPGRAFLMGLPYLMGDKDPYDPVHGWDKTWAYLKALDGCIPYYPGGTAAVMKELGEGSRDITPTQTGWDINTRALGVVPANFKVQAFDGFTWVNDAHYIVVPKGVSAEKRAVIAKVI
ncbi:MAG: extracellular solute-binding protein, partial [Comamonas sp.]